ncbi:hypothetical protein AALO_G00221550 [Alosa alosa]|uniref:Uncharacterized protein n=1 Tax=Alosa alosa TaxID=278164 RepID=A0AAV6FXF4_9TELE|nr:hypothetical protein AALO_G00221550 [Alosa alosa]
MSDCHAQCVTLESPEHVTFPTRGQNTLDLVYTPQKEAYKAKPLPHIGQSDHISILLLPRYRQRAKVTKPVLKEVRVWPEGAVSQLQDCFETTDWDIFKTAATHNNHIDIEEYTDTVTSYITKCINVVTEIKHITTRANQKPWLTGDVHRLLRARDKAFKAGDVAGLRTARANLSQGIRKAKKDYTDKITTHFKDSRDAQSLWQGIQAITDYKPAPQSCENNTSLLNDLNRFFARFEAQNDTHPQKTPPPPHDQPLYLSSASVKRTLATINPRKAAGPDNIHSKFLDLPGTARTVTDARRGPVRELRHVVKMLLKVQHERTKKYVKLEEVSFSDFINAVKQKFLIPEDKVLKVADEQGIEVDEDVFPELATEAMCFVISTDDDFTLLQQDGEGSSCPSLTDTLSLSSSLSSPQSDAGSQMIQPVMDSMDSTRAKNVIL